MFEDSPMQTQLSHYKLAILLSSQGPADQIFKLSVQLSIGNKTLFPLSFYALPCTAGDGNQKPHFHFSLQGSRLDSNTEKLSHGFYKVEDTRSDTTTILPAWAFRDVKFCSGLLTFPGEYQFDIAGSCDHLQLLPAV